MAEANRYRITWVDYAKGIGIFLVVLGHVIRGLNTSRLIADSPSFRFVDSWIYSFHMPLFFLLSGLFAERQMKLRAGPYFIDKLASLGYPYLVWSTLQTLMQVAVGRQANSRTSLHDLLGILIHPIQQFWSLYVLFLISLIYYGLRRIGLGPAAVLGAFLVFLASGSWIPIGSWWPLIAARNDGIYYALGSLLNHHESTSSRLERVPIVALIAIVALGYGLIAAWVARPHGASPLVDLPLALGGIASSIALAILLSRARGLDLIRTFGVYSLEIYVAHTIFTAGLRIVLQKYLKIEDVSIHLIVGTIGGIAIPLILAKLCRRFHVEFLFRWPRRLPTTRPA